eukprot:2349839-Rhodomonas_salina.2
MQEVRGPRSDEEDARSAQARSRSGEASEEGSDGDVSSVWSADDDSEEEAHVSDDDDSDEEEGDGRVLAKAGIESIPVVGELSSFVPLWAVQETRETKIFLNLHGGVSVSTCIPSEATKGLVWKSSGPPAPHPRADDCNPDKRVCGCVCVERGAGVQVSMAVRQGLGYSSTIETDLEVTCSNTTVRLLRDHTLLLSALLADASWRPRTGKLRGADRHFFVPTANKVKVVLKDQYRLGLVVNEENIVDDFGDDRINNVVWVRGREAWASASSLPTVFKELQTRQILSVELPKVSVDLHPRRTDDVFGTMPGCIKVSRVLCGLIPCS